MGRKAINDREATKLAQAREQFLASEGHDAREFAANLDRLTRMHKLTREQAANRIGAPYQWYRRVVTKGLKRINSENLPYLEALASLFGLGDIEDLWRPELIRFQMDDEPETHLEAIQYIQSIRQEQELSLYAEKLDRLLASGKHEYLKELIDRLHETLPPEFPEPVPMASSWSSKNDEEEEVE